MTLKTISKSKDAIQFAKDNETPLSKAIGKPYSQQLGRKAGKGAGKIVSKENNLISNRDLKDVIDEIVAQNDGEYGNFNFKNILKDFSLGNFSYKVTSDGEGLLRNMKNKGFPDLDEINRKLKNRGYEFEEGWGDSQGNLNEKQFDELFWEDVRIQHDIISEEFPGFTVAGRSGGYWGVDKDNLDDYLRYDINYSNIKEKIKKDINKYNKENPESSNLDLQNYLINSDHVFEVIKENISVIPTRELKNLDKTISSVIKNFESTNRWIDQFINNDYVVKK